MSRMSEAFTVLLVRGAARAAPSDLSARLEEEWLADLSARASRLARLRFATGCYWASLAIGLQHRPVSARLAADASGNVSTFGEPAGLFSGRALTFGAVVGLHVAIFFGLMMARTQYLKPVEHAPLVPRVIDSAPQPPIKAPPPMIDSTFAEKTPPHLDFPRIEPEIPSVASDSSAASQEPSGMPATAPPQPILRVQGGAGSTFPHPGDYYPDVSRRLEEQGAAVLQVCVDATGRLTSDPVKQASSGFERLDAAAVRLARAASGHYRPTTEDGKPVSACYPIKIRFQLQN